jgi:hypothetical protein
LVLFDYDDRFRALAATQRLPPRKRVSDKKAHS